MRHILLFALSWASIAGWFVAFGLSFRLDEKPGQAREWVAILLFGYILLGLYWIGSALGAWAGLD